MLNGQLQPCLVAFANIRIFRVPYSDVTNLLLIINSWPYPFSQKGIYDRKMMFFLRCASVLPPFCLRCASVVALIFQR